MELGVPLGECAKPEACTSEHCHPLRRDTNVLVLARLDELRAISTINLCLAVASTMYLSSNMCLAILNMYDNECYPCPEAAVRPDFFHRFEFTAAFLFSVVSTLSLVFSPERRFDSPALLRLLLFGNVGTTFLSACLVWTNVERFETLSHEVEYSNELTMALLDLILVQALVQRPDGWTQKAAAVGSVVMAMGVAVLQLTVYNLGHEQAAHCLEFSFGVVSAAVAF